MLRGTLELEGITKHPVCCSIKVCGPGVFLHSNITMLDGSRMLPNKLTSRQYEHPVECISSLFKEDTVSNMIF